MRWRSEDVQSVGIGVLGPLSHDGAATFGRRDRAVLTALAMYVGRAVSADALADAVWGADPPPSSHKALQGCVVRLRKALGAAAIQTSAQGYRLVVPVDEVDAQRFERMVARCRELLALGEPERAAYVAVQALDLWRGRAFEDVESWDLAAVEAGRLDELRLETEELRVDASLRTGRHLDVLATAESMVRAAPLRERRWTLLALAQYQSGRQTEALRTIHRVKSLLADRLGLDSGPDLASLEEGILRQDDSLLARGSIPASPTCPYQGLMPYDVEDSESFFGRDDDVRVCLDLLNTRHALSVVGPSGSGKSSLVRAGVAAALRRDSRLVLIITPGDHPMQSLAAVSDPRPRSVLLVDQCEEAFSLCGDAAERKAFFAALVRRSEREPVVLAMRADRLADVAAHPGFARLLESGLHLLGALSEQGLRDAVEAPARQAGLLIEAGLVDLLVGEVEGTPAALPMLSHALLETWKRREGNTLTVAGYTATGGIRRAVAQSAEEVYASIDPGHRPMLRDLVLRLVTAGTEGEPIRGRVPRRLLSLDPDHEHLIDLLVASRLVTSDAGVVEIAHEALAREWPRLRAWLDDDIDGQRILHHLTSAADAWDSLGRPDSELYRGVRLAQTVDWRAQSDTVLTSTEVAFIDAAKQVAEAEQRSAAERARQQARLIRRLRGVLAGAAVLLVAALIAGTLAVRQADRADRSANAASAAETASEARRVGALALTTDDIDMSMLLAVAGVRLDDTPETRSSLLAALAKHPELVTSTQMARAPVIYFDVSPDGRTVATYDTTNHVRLYRIRTGELLGEFQAGSDRQLSWQSGQVEFSPDGKTLAVVMAAPTHQPVRLLDAETLEPQPAQLGGMSRHRWEFLDLAYTGDGRRLAATMWRVEGSGSALTTTSTWAFAWDLDAPRRPVARIRLQDGNAGVALRPDGSVLYTTQPLTIHDLVSGTSRPVPNPEPVERIATSPDGRVIAAPGRGGLLLLDAATGRLLRRLEGNGDLGFYVNFSGDGSRVATVTFDKREALVWDVGSGGLRARLPLGESGEAIDFGPDGSTVYTAGSDSSLRHWDVDGGRRFIAQVASTTGRADLSYLSYVQPAPGGDFITYLYDDHVSFLNVRANTVGDPLQRGQGYRRGGGSWHPDGVHYALATGGEIRVWDARTGDLAVEGLPSGSYISGIDYSTDGSRLVIGELSGRITMLDPATLEPVGRPVQLDQPVCCVSAGPDNHTAVALTGFDEASGFYVGASTHWALVDLESGTVIEQGPLDINGREVALSPDGRHAAVGGQGGEVLVLDLDSGEPVGPPVISHDDAVLSLTYSPDGHKLLTSGSDSSVGLWEGSTGRLIAQVVTPKRFNQAGFRRDPNSVLIAPVWGGPVYEWDTRGESAVGFACRVAGRDLTKTEWTEQFGARPYQHVCSA
jgi:WD40 repeat protein/DNA-binding SARP family transcriptional activator